MTNNKFKYILQEAIRNYDESQYNRIENYILGSYNTRLKARTFSTQKMYIKNNEVYLNIYINKDIVERKPQLPILNGVKLTKKKNKYLLHTYLCQYISNLTLDNIWQWAWSVPNVDKIYLKKAKEIFDWAFSNNNIDATTKDLLLTSKQQIVGNNQLAIFLSMSLYLSKYDVIYTEFEDNGPKYYILKVVE